MGALLSRCLRFDAADRPTITEVLDCLVDTGFRFVEDVSVAEVIDRAWELESVKSDSPRACQMLKARADTENPFRSFQASFTSVEKALSAILDDPPLLTYVGPGVARSASQDDLLRDRADGNTDRVNV
jgi:hypothetical protein